MPKWPGGLNGCAALLMSTVGKKGYLKKGPFFTKNKKKKKILRLLLTFKKKLFFFFSFLWLNCYGAVPAFLKKFATLPTGSSGRGPFFLRRHFLGPLCCFPSLPYGQCYAGGRSHFLLFFFYFICFFMAAKRSIGLIRSITGALPA
jgi:hypothetical protein